MALRSLARSSAVLGVTWTTGKAGDGNGNLLHAQRRLRTLLNHASGLQD